MSRLTNLPEFLFDAGKTMYLGITKHDTWGYKRLKRIGTDMPDTRTSIEHLNWKKGEGCRVLIINVHNGVYSKSSTLM